MTLPENQRPLRVVAIGGGTGLSTLLRGLKHYTKPFAAAAPSSREGPHPQVISLLTAVVTVTDDGGSSGRLRRDLGVLPPGDVRNCIAALSEDESLLSRLFQFRFPEAEDGLNTGLGGHSFGNLFLAALTHTFRRPCRCRRRSWPRAGRSFPRRIRTFA